MKHSGKIFWLVVFAAILLYLQMECCDSLTYLEQMQLFLFTSDYASEVIRQPSGMAVYVSRFLNSSACHGLEQPLLLHCLRWWECCFNRFSRAL